MRKTFQTFWIALIFGFLTCIPLNAEDLSYEVDKILYSEVEKTFTAIMNIWEEDSKLKRPANKAEREKAKEESVQKQKAVLDKLLALEKPGEAKVISHILLHKAKLTLKSRSMTDNETYASRVLLVYGLSKYSSQAILTETIKYLETPDQDIIKVFRKFHIELLSFKKDSELEMFSFVLGADKLPTKGLVDFLYSLPFSMAVHPLARNYSRNDEEKDEFLKLEQLIIKDSNPDKHYISKYPPVYPKSIQASGLVKDKEVVNALHKLSKSEAWWQRHYVVKLLQVIPKYRIPEIVERLSKDDHPLIQGELVFLAVDK